VEASGSVEEESQDNARRPPASMSHGRMSAMTVRAQSQGSHCVLTCGISKQKYKTKEASVPSCCTKEINVSLALFKWDSFVQNTT
jgi:hypothetical protein